MKSCGLSHLSKFKVLPVAYKPSVLCSIVHPFIKYIYRADWDGTRNLQVTFLISLTSVFNCHLLSTALIHYFLLTAYLTILFHLHQYSPLPPLISYEFLIYCIIHLLSQLLISSLSEKVSYMRAHVFLLVFLIITQFL